jgi:hypothetical protein
MLVTVAECSSVNLWDCFFLPSTNCTLPTEIKPGDSLFDQANSTATPVKTSLDKQTRLTQGYKESKSPYKRRMTLNTTLNIEQDSTIVTTGKENNVYNLLFPFAILFRFKTAFAKLVFEHEERWRNSFAVAFHPSERCVVRKNPYI